MQQLIRRAGRPLLAHQRPYIAVRSRRLVAVLSLAVVVVSLVWSAVATAGDAVERPTFVSPPSSGLFLRGVVSVTATGSADSSVAALAVDGSRIATAAPSAAGPRWTFTWDTRTAAAGRRVLAVRALEPTESAETTRWVTVDNVAPRLAVLTPIVRFNPAVGQRGQVRWKASDPVTSTCSLTIWVSNGRYVVRRGRVNGWVTPPGRTFTWVWDGRDHYGRSVPRGRYTVCAATVDAAGNRRGIAATSVAVVGRYIVVIDAGHQGRADLRPEPIGPGSSITKPRVAGGASGVVSRLPESRVTLAVALRLERLLKARGYAVVMCRRTQDVNISNRQRAELANRAHADLFVRIHLDGMPGSSASGTSMLYPAVNTWTKPIAARSRVAAGIVHARLVRALGLPNRGLVARGDLTGFNWAKVPAVLPELAFMSNARDDRLLASSAGQDKAARGLADGIAAYLER